MSSFGDDLAVIESDEIEVVSDEERKRRHMQGVENRVILENLRVFHDATFFAELDFPDDVEDIEQVEEARLQRQRTLELWAEELGSMEEAKRRYRTAKYALMSAKDAPVGLKMAQGIVSAAVKGSAARSLNIGQLNIGKALVVGPIPEFPEMKVKR